MYDVRHGINLEPMQGNGALSPVDLGSTEVFCIPAVTSVSFKSVTVFLGTLWGSNNQIKAPDVFDGEHGNALHAMQGNWASSHDEGEDSWFFTSFGRNQGCILEFRW